MAIGETYQALFDSLEPELLRDVMELYRQEALEEALACESDRADLGNFSREHPARRRDGLGILTHRLHLTDYWAQQIVHRAPNDSGLWKWFLKTPEGAYARVPTERATRIVVPAWKGSLWNTVTSDLSAA